MVSKLSRSTLSASSFTPLFSEHTSYFITSSKQRSTNTSSCLHIHICTYKSRGLEWSFMFCLFLKIKKISLNSKSPLNKLNLKNSFFQSYHDWWWELLPSTGYVTMRDSETEYIEALGTMYCQKYFSNMLCYLFLIV